jgi:hypothetical protein
MIFLYFVLICFNGHIYLNASDKNGIIWSQVALSQESAKMYEQDRKVILTYCRNIFERNYEFANIEFRSQKYETAMISLGRKLTAIELLNSMLLEESNHFLSVFWFSIRNIFDLLERSEIKSLWNIRISSTTKFPSLRRIFDNYRIYMSQAFVKLKIDPADPSTGYNLLSTFQLFWYNKLEPLGRKILGLKSFRKQKKLIEERFHFINIFLFHIPEDLLIREFKRLLQDTKKEKPKSTLAIRNFCFLAKVFVRQLDDIRSFVFLEKLKWLASQTSNFLIYFFYFLNWTFLEYPDRCHLFYPFDGRMDVMKDSVRLSIIIDEGRLSVFKASIFSFSQSYKEIRHLAQQIVRKTNI